MLPTVLISASARARITAELERVYPAEGMAVPLVGLTRRDEAANPCELLGLRQIREVVIAEAVLVPEAQQVNARARVSVLPRTDEQVNAEVLALIRRHPRLRACGYLHSHPFARGQTHPSRGAGCDYEGHMLPLRQQNRACNLDTSFSFIACRSPSGRGWVLQSFALDFDDEIVDLGPARTIADDGAQVRRCLLAPLTSRTPQRQLLRRWRRSLRRSGLRFRVDELFDGWWRVVIRVAEGRSVAMLVPLGFPAEAVQVYAVKRGPRGAAVVQRADPSRASSPDAWLRAVAEAREGVTR